MTKLTFLLTLALIGSFSHRTNAETFDRLHSPYPVTTVLPDGNIINKEIVECPAPPEAISDMVYQSIYTDRSNGVSIVDEKAKKKYKTAIKNITDFERQISKWIEKGLYQSGTTDRPIKCAVQWMTHWAEEKSMLGGKTNFQGEAMRKWTLAVISSHYVRIKDLGGLDKNQKKIIELWIKRLTKSVIKDYKKNPESMSRNNNHMYWSAWAVMISGVALNDLNFYRYGQREYKKAINQIQDDGLLPNEVYRESKAFNYHVFATAPLIMMAETMAVNDDNGYGYINGKIHKLINRIIEELDTNQAYLENITGAPQNIKGTIQPHMLAWLEAYNARFINKDVEKWLIELRPMVQRRIGGNLTNIYAGKTNRDSHKSEQ